MAVRIDVQTGEVKAGGRDTLIESSGIGSCIAAVAYDPVNKVGGIAHVMLPGASPKPGGERTRYAADGVEELIKLMKGLGAETQNLVAFMVGGGNVLNSPDDSICRMNAESVAEVLRKHKVCVAAEAVGGTTRRSVALDVASGEVSYTEGDGAIRSLWAPQAGAKG
jgi:chemotaxis protein CheD